MVTATPDPQSFPLVMLKRADEPATKLPLGNTAPLLSAREGACGEDASTVSKVAEAEQFPTELHNDVFTHTLPSAIEEKFCVLLAGKILASRIVVPLFAYSTDKLSCRPLFHPLEGDSETVRFSEMYGPCI